MIRKGVELGKRHHLTYDLEVSSQDMASQKCHICAKYHSQSLQIFSELDLATPAAKDFIAHGLLN